VIAFLIIKTPLTIRECSKEIKCQELHLGKNGLSGAKYWLWRDGYGLPMDSHGLPFDKDELLFYQNWLPLLLNALLADKYGLLPYQNRIPRQFVGFRVGRWLVFGVEMVRVFKELVEII
jgi:hypothetical protein